MSNSVTYLNHTPMIEWCASKCASNNKYHGDKQISKRDQTTRSTLMLTILGLVIDVGRGGDLHDHLMSTRAFTLTMN